MHVAQWPDRCFIYNSLLLIWHRVFICVISVCLSRGHDWCFKCLSQTVCITRMTERKPDQNIVYHYLVGSLLPANYQPHRLVTGYIRYPGSDIQDNDECCDMHWGTYIV